MSPSRTAGCWLTHMHEIGLDWDQCPAVHQICVAGDLAAPQFVCSASILTTWRQWRLLFDLPEYMGLVPHQSPKQITAFLPRVMNLASVVTAQSGCRSTDRAGCSMARTTARPRRAKAFHSAGRILGRYHPRHPWELRTGLQLVFFPPAWNETRGTFWACCCLLTFASGYADEIPSEGSVVRKESRRRSRKRRKKKGKASHHDGFIQTHLLLEDEPSSSRRWQTHLEWQTHLLLEDDSFTSRNHCERDYCTDPWSIQHGRIFDEGGD